MEQRLPGRQESVGLCMLRSLNRSAVPRPRVGKPGLCLKIQGVLVAEDTDVLTRKEDRRERAFATDECQSQRFRGPASGPMSFETKPRLCLNIQGVLVAENTEVLTRKEDRRERAFATDECQSQRFRGPASGPMSFETKPRVKDSDQ